MLGLVAALSGEGNSGDAHPANDRRTVDLRLKIECVWWRLCGVFRKSKGFAWKWRGNGVWSENELNIAQSNISKNDYVFEAGGAAGGLNFTLPTG